MRPLLEKDPGEVGEDLQKRGSLFELGHWLQTARSVGTLPGTAVYVALRLNSAQVRTKRSLDELQSEYA